MLTKITAIIPTLNEEDNIRQALNSVSFADEIIVIDSFSSDKTIDIVKQSSAKLIQRKFDDFSSQKNFAIQQATHEWVFLLDADEVITEALKKEIVSKLNSNHNSSAFYIYRKFFFQKKRMYFSGLQRDKVIRLFKKEGNFYLGKVHEKVITKETPDVLLNSIHHYSYKNYDQYKKKLEYYSKLQAQELFEKGKIGTPLHLFFKPLIRFFIQFIVKLGFLDSWRGFIISYVHSYAVFRRYVELRNLRGINKSTLNGYK